MGLFSQPKDSEPKPRNTYAEEKPKEEKYKQSFAEIDEEGDEEEGYSME